MADIKYEIVEELGVLSENARGWRKELNLVSWNGAQPKYDLRDWAPEHEKMGKGITLTAAEVKELKSATGRYRIERGGSTMNTGEVRVIETGRYMELAPLFQEAGLEIHIEGDAAGHDHLLAGRR